MKVQVEADSRGPGGQGPVRPAENQGGRFWGVWSEGKLDVLRRYLEAFGSAAQRAPHRVYLDLFAGQLDNYSRSTSDAIEGSAEIALTVPNPPFTHYVFFERPRRAKVMQRALSKRFPDRNIRVYSGDCNATVFQALSDLASLRRSPSFALIDPDAVDVRWATLQALAAHKAAGSTKVEMWLLFPHAMFTRMLPRDRDRMTIAAVTKMDGLFGSDEWRPIYEARVADRLSPPEAREEYVNLMRWLLEKRLRYRFTLTLAVSTAVERPLYDMIFATDSDAGKRIMSHLHGRAQWVFPLMRQEARWLQHQREVEATGQGFLFSPEDPGAVAWAANQGKGVKFEYDPPWLPIGQTEAEA